MESIKVSMQVPITSADWTYAPGDVVELDKELADAWVEAGHAQKIEGEKVNKTALPDGVEYFGFGVFLAGGQRFNSKKDAIEFVKAGGSGAASNNVSDSGAGDVSGS